MTKHEIGFASQLTFKVIVAKLSHQMNPRFGQTVAKCCSIINIIVLQNKTYKRAQHLSGPAPKACFFSGHTEYKTVVILCSLSIKHQMVYNY